MPEQLMKEPLTRATALSARKPLSNELVVLEPKSRNRRSDRKQNVIRNEGDNHSLNST